MDDDLELERGWLDHLMDTLEESGADVALGPVRPRFAGTCPPWDPEAARFTRVLPGASGTAVVAGGARKGGTFVVSTASSLWRRATCFTDALPFDPAFGVSGGEDLDLFLRLQSRGCRFVWCAEAGVWETIPASRTSLRYHALREFTGAQVYAATSARHADRPSLRIADIMARGGGAGGAGRGRAAGGRSVGAADGGGRAAPPGPAAAGNGGRRRQAGLVAQDAAVPRRESPRLMAAGHGA